MTTSAAGRERIERFEERRTVAYRDQRGIPTIGYGHTLDVKMGDSCTPEQADEWLAEDLEAAEHCINRLVTTTLSQNQFDALVSLVFNIGCGNFADSTVRRRLNALDYAGAADAILMWNKAAGETNQGLVNRREAERELFLSA